jgi:catechol 2,3-dioxygenase-like lactoylglutathione lyase family enzyme
MAILGIEAVIYGVDDLDLNFNFWRDYGLNPIKDGADEKVLECQNGARMVLHRYGDPGLPTAYNHQKSVHETIWGVDTDAAFDTLVAGLRSDREVRIDPEGVAHFLAEGGIPMGLKVWKQRPFVSQPDPVNAPGHIVRLNQHRKWRMKCRPKTINHIVFFVDDYVKTYEWFRDRLGFRYTDHSKGIGVFVRADGAFEHHNMFFVSMKTPIAPEKPGFMHMSFGLEDIDEMMLGVQTMKAKGWQKEGYNTRYGLCRHRISSAIYYYFDIPSGGEAEYNVDSDYVDDNWIPRAWEFKFGSLLWATHVHDLWKGEVAMDMSFDPEATSLEPFRIGESARQTETA